MSKDNRDKPPTPDQDSSAAEVEAQQADLNEAIDAANTEQAIKAGPSQPVEPETSPPEAKANSSDTSNPNHSVALYGSSDPPGGRKYPTMQSKAKAASPTPAGPPPPPPPPPGPTPKPTAGEATIPPPPPPPRIIAAGKMGGWAEDSSVPPPSPSLPPPAQKAPASAPDVSITPVAATPIPLSPPANIAPSPPPVSGRLSGKGLRPWETGVIAPIADPTAAIPLPSAATAPAPPQGAPNTSQPPPPPTRQRPAAPTSPTGLSPIGSLNRGATAPAPNTIPSQTQTAVHNAATVVQGPALNTDYRPVAEQLPQLSGDLATKTIDISEFTGPAPGDTDTPPSDAELHLAAEYLFQGDNGQANLQTYKQVHEKYVELAAKHERGLGMGAISGGFRKMLKMGAPTRKEVIEAGDQYDEMRQFIGYKLATVLKTAGYSDKQVQDAVKLHDELQIGLTGESLRDTAESRAKTEYTDPNQKPGFIGMRRAKFYQSYMKAGRIKKAAMVGAIGVPIGVGAALVTPAMGAAAAVAGVVGASRFAKGILGAKINSEVSAVTRAEDRRRHREGIAQQLIDSQYTGRTGNVGEDLYKPASGITEVFSDGVIEAANKNRKHTIFRLGAIAAFGSAGAAAADYLSDNSGEISDLYSSTVGNIFGGGDGKSSATINSKDLPDLGDTFDNFRDKALALTDQEAEAQAADASTPEASAENSFGDKERHFQRTEYNNSLFGLPDDETAKHRIQLHQSDGKMVTLREFNGDNIVELELDPDGGFTSDAKDKLKAKGFDLKYVEPGDSKSPNGRWDIVDERTDAQRGISHDTSSDSAVQPSGTVPDAETGDLIGEADESGGAAAPDQDSGLTGSVDSDTPKNQDTGLTGSVTSGLTGGSIFAPNAGDLTGTVNNITPEQMAQIAHEDYLKKLRELAEAGGLTGTTEDK